MGSILSPGRPSAPAVDPNIKKRQDEKQKELEMEERAQRQKISSRQRASRGRSQGMRSLISTSELGVNTNRTTLG